MLSLGIGLGPSFAIAATLWAAVASPAMAQVQTNTTASNLPATRLKVTTNLVVVRVVVRDAQGKQVKGLRKEDFRLFDSGKEQPIAQFEVESATEPLPPPAVAHKPEQSPAVLSSALPGRFLALYFDDLYTSDTDLIQIRQAAGNYLATNLQPEDRVAIFTSGTMLSDFTSDPKQIQEALARLKTSPRAFTHVDECPNLSDYQAIEMMKTAGNVNLDNPWITGDAWGLAFDEAVRRNCLPCTAGCSTAARIANKDYLLNRATTVDGQAEILRRSNLGELEQVVKYTSQMPGQRTVILGSPGFLLGDDQFALERIIDHALRLQVVISSLDPRGLPVLMRQADASLSFIPSGGAAGAMHRLDLNREVLAGDVLAQVAEGTGGEYFHNSNDLKGGFGRLAGSPGAYILAFAPRDLKPDGKFHKLKVTLAEKQPTYIIQARRGYFAPRNEADAKAEAEEVEASMATDQGQEQIREALLSKTEITQFPVGLDTKVKEGQGETHELSLLSQVDPKSLHLQKESNRNLNTLTFVFGVFDHKDNLLISQQRHATVDVADEQLPEFLKGGMNVDIAFPLKPGSYRIREVVTDSEHRLTTLSRNVDIPNIIPAAPAASVPPHPSPLPTPIPQEVTRSESDPATGALLLRVWDNVLGYLTTIPNVFADEHVVSSVTSPYKPLSKQAVHDAEMDSTIDSTVDSIFRLKRVSTDGKTADLVESREVKYVDHHAATEGQSLTGPALLIGAFSRAPNVLAPQFKDCYDYRLLPSLRRKPGDTILFLHADVRVLEYALKLPSPAGIECPVPEQTTGRVFIDPSSMQIVRLEQRRPRHDEGAGRLIDWSWSIDYTRVMMEGKPFWLPRTIASKASSVDGSRIRWNFLATYSNYHLMTVTSTMLPAANNSQH